ncbi:TRAP transporter substrate-binding protein DctP [Dethiosulfovibrio sp. F2B]|uniref:TRAP transporter substrate-binding protein DctP n=1 Tax=Dethiosulfovibrio faecalis TaxID=2720018 RepID=UPI001F3A70CB|nr:TRAP transporter substrate-binding protein DctP [Dethiosulfovibrio faecalis]
MKSRILSILLVFIALTATEACGNIYRWRLAEEEVEGSVCDLYAREFARLLNEKSKGAIELSVFPLGTLGTPQEIYELCRQGSVDFLLDGAGQVGARVPENQIFSIPFFFSDDDDENERILSQSVALNEYLTSAYERQGITVLAYWNEGAMDWTSNRNLTSPEDFRGLKIRTMPSSIIGKCYETLGAKPRIVPFMDVYSSLHLGHVEAQENPPYVVEEMGFMDFQSHYVRSKHKIYVMQTMVNLKMWKGLPQEVRDIVSDSIEELRPLALKIQREQNRKKLDKIVSSMEKGQRYVSLSKEQRDVFRSAFENCGSRLYLENSNDKQLAQRIYETIKKEIEEVTGR